MGIMCVWWGYKVFWTLFCQPGIMGQLPHLGGLVTSLGLSARVYGWDLKSETWGTLGCVSLPTSRGGDKTSPPTG